VRYSVPGAPTVPIRLIVVGGESMVSAPPLASQFDQIELVNGGSDQIHLPPEANPSGLNGTSITETTTESTDSTGSSAASGTDGTTNELREETNGEEILKEHETKVQFFNTE